MFQRCDLSFLFLPNFTPLLILAVMAGGTPRELLSRLHRPWNGLLDVRDLDNIRRSVSSIDGGFWRSSAALARSSHLGTFAPITKSHRVSDPSPRMPGTIL